MIWLVFVAGLWVGCLVTLLLVGLFRAETKGWRLDNGS